MTPHAERLPVDRVLDHIRRGEAPSSDRISALTDPSEVTLGAVGARRLGRALRDELLGLGPLEPLVADDAVTDVLVNGDGSVWVDRGDGAQRSDIGLGSPERVRELAVRLASLCGQRLDDACPYVDGRLPEGSRLHAILAPISAHGAHVSIRRPARQALMLGDLVDRGALPSGLAGVLRDLVRAKVSFVVSGGTGAGKTTVLGALLNGADPRERVVLVEDVHELSLALPHVVSLQARQPNVEGVGGIGLSALVRQAVRMRPDRLVVGEVRGPEVLDLLTAMNTGHEGGCGTVHANAIDAVPARFEALGVLAGLDRQAVHALLAAAVAVVVHVERQGAHRRVCAVGVRTVRAGLVVIEPAWCRDGAGAGVLGPGWPTVAALLGRADWSGAEVGRC